MARPMVSRCWLRAVAVDRVGTVLDPLRAACWATLGGDLETSPGIAEIATRQHSGSAATRG